jgi:7-carboxy-7-deazaguanine synthase
MSFKTYLTARLVEIFSAIQGEGLNVGTRQLFIRFAMCDLRCHFCDSAHTWDIPNECRVEQTPGRRDFETYPNPVPGIALLQWVDRQNQPGLHDSISLTGGEPLLQAPFLVEFLPQLRQVTRLPLYLETGGHRPQQLKMVLPYLDSVGMDIKLKSVSGEDKWQAHAEFLQLCDNSSHVEVFVKLIVDRNTDPTELEQASQLVADVNPKIPVFLQPVTPLEESNRLVLPPSPEQVLAWQALMKRTLSCVRVVPQTHKAIGQL